MKIVADKDIPFLKGVLEPWAEVVYLRGDAIAPRDVRDADALLVRTRTRCDAALLEGSRVRFVGTATIGFDHVDTAWCAAHGVEVATAAGCNRRGVLQWVSAALAWMASERGLEPSRTTLGVVGVGNVGSLVARYAAAWGFRVMRSDPPRERAEGLGAAEGYYPLGTIAAECDVLTLHVPLSTSGPDATRHMVEREFLARMKPESVVFNSSRGAVLEPAALREASATRGFAIDTWNGEPTIDREVLFRALLATPHIAGYSAQGKATATSMVVGALARRFELPLGAERGAHGGDDVLSGAGDHRSIGADGLSRGEDWYPAGALRSEPREIGWDEMRRLMPSHFDIAAQSAALKASPERFEAMRDGYDYRVEFF